MSRATITDIARELGVSPSTVSRALRNHPDISANTIRLVKEAAERLDYFPDSLAQGFKKQRTSTIGIIVPEIRHHFFSSAISGIEEVAYANGFTIMVCQSNEDCEREKINLRALVSHRAAGLLISLSQTTVDISHFQTLERQKIPSVFFDRTHKDINASRVIVDDFDGACSMVTHLIQRGYRRIAHIGGPENLLIGQERARGYLQALLNNSIVPRKEYLVRSGCRREDGEELMRQLLLLPQRPDAVFCVNDPVAVGAFTVLKEQNIRIPQEVALAGFSNNPLASLLEPKLTTVHQPSYEIGKTAATMLLDQIEKGYGNVPPKTIIKKTNLIIRDST